MRPYVILICCLLAAAAPAAACPPGQYESCILGACACLPEIGGAVGEGAEHLKKELEAQVGGNPLAVWLQGSRDTAVGTSSPMPLQIRQALTGYIEEDVMNRARFKIGDNGVINLAGLTLTYGDYFSGGGIAAVTLIDVIVFQDANNAYNNPSLWAHELTHVKQFRDWGTRDFAIRYARDAGAVENEAYAVGNNYAAWKARQFTSPNFPPPFVPPPPPLPPPTFPSGWMMQACGCWANPVQAAPEPRCQRGWVRINPCAGSCGPGRGVPFAYVCQ
jgi:Domain of unknown function (DUF4157)